MEPTSSSSSMTDFLMSLSATATATVAEKPSPEAKASEDAPLVSAIISSEPKNDVSSFAQASEDKSVDAPKDAAPVEEPKADAAPAPVAAAKVRVIVKALRAMEQSIANVIRLLEEDQPAAAAALATEPVDLAMMREVELAGFRQADGRVVEGVFDGQGMVGSDGKTYSVPPNYASKSKLVEGDMLKLTITPKGSFIYKQIGPIDRSRVVASLGFDATNGEFYATSESKRWSVIKASVTYFKGELGDEVVLLVPKNAPSKWAAVENIIKTNPIV